MRRLFYTRLAAGSMGKHKSTWLPYLFTCVISAMMYYIITSLATNPGLTVMYGAKTIASMLEFGSWIITFFIAIFLFYTHSFLIKRRQRELALYNILGMTKRQLSLMLICESTLTFLLGVGAGLIFGILLDKVMYLLIVRMLNVEITLGFYISTQAIIRTIALFAAIFGLILISTVRHVRVSNPAQLMQSAASGDREPKTRHVLAILGAICLGSGYAISFMIKDALTSIPAFFIAVLLVIAGTYMLFTAGSIAVLKLMRRNRRLYYQPRHFTTISGMIYRMKQNAVGLANICILATMVLVMLSSTGALMVGLKSSTAKLYPYQYAVYWSTEYDQAATRERIRRDMPQIAANAGFDAVDSVCYSFLPFMAQRNGTEYTPITTVGVDAVTSAIQGIVTEELVIVTLDDYNRETNSSEALSAGQILIYSTETPVGGDTITIFGHEYFIAKHLDTFPDAGMAALNTRHAQYIVVADAAALSELNDAQQSAYESEKSTLRTIYAFNTAMSDSKQYESAGAYYDMVENARDAFFSYATRVYAQRTSIRIVTIRENIELFGGLLFIGIFLSLLFTVMTALIIYYKQIAEGYEDRVRFSIMRRVGMSQSEVRASIRTQILTVFFLPLIVAGIHTLAAYPIVSNLLMLTALYDATLYLKSIAVSFAAFSVIYTAIYAVTTRTYERLVQQ